MSDSHIYHWCGFLMATTKVVDLVVGINYQSLFRKEAQLHLLLLSKFSYICDTWSIFSIENVNTIVEQQQVIVGYHEVNMQSIKLYNKEQAQLLNFATVTMANLCSPQYFPCQNPNLPICQSFTSQKFCAIWYLVIY